MRKRTQSMYNIMNDTRYTSYNAPYSENYKMCSWLQMCSIVFSISVIYLDSDLGNLLYNQTTGVTDGSLKDEFAFCLNQFFIWIINFACCIIISCSKIFYSVMWEIYFLLLSMLIMFISLWELLPAITTKPVWVMSIPPSLSLTRLLAKLIPNVCVNLYIYIWITIM